MCFAKTMRRLLQFDSARHLTLLRKAGPTDWLFSWASPSLPPGREPYMLKGQRCLAIELAAAWALDNHGWRVQLASKYLLDKDDS